ncbi:hypothetical protein ACFLT9_12885 [Acidobacteriota bacterium]
MKRNRPGIQWISCILAVLCILGSAPNWGISQQTQDEKNTLYRERLEKLKLLAVSKMRAIRERSNEKFKAISKDLEDMPPEEIGKWLKNHRSEEAQAAQILKESALQREMIYKQFTAERERLESVYKAGGMGKVGYVFIGDVEYNPTRRPLEAWHAGLRNLVTFGWATGNEPSKLEDFAPLIQKKEEMMGQKFDRVITVYLARGEALTKALGDPDTGGYVWISHGGRNKREVYDDNGDPVNADTIKPLVDAARDGYIKEKLPEHLAKIYTETRSPDPDISERARAKLDELVGEERELYDYVRGESLKVSLDLDYVEHYACLSGASGAQKLADMLTGKDGVFIGYEGVLDHTGEAGRVTFGGTTSPPTEFKSQDSPDPDPQGTIRKKRADKPRELSTDEQELLKILQRTSKVSVAFYACAGITKERTQYGRKEKEMIPCGQATGLLLTAEASPLTWSGSSFHGVFSFSDQPAGSSHTASTTVTIRGSVDINRRIITQVSIKRIYDMKPLSKVEYSNGETISLAEELSLGEVPLESEKWGYFRFAAKGTNCRTMISNFQVNQTIKGFSIGIGGAGRDLARELGLKDGVVYPYEKKENRSMANINWEIQPVSLRVSLTPTAQRKSWTSTIWNNH